MRIAYKGYEVISEQNDDGHYDIYINENSFSGLCLYHGISEVAPTIKQLKDNVDYFLNNNEYCEERRVDEANRAKELLDRYDFSTVLKNASFDMYCSIETVSGEMIKCDPEVLPKCLRNLSEHELISYLEEKYFVVFEIEPVPIMKLQSYDSDSIKVKEE